MIMNIIRKARTLLSTLKGDSSQTDTTSLSRREGIILALIVLTLGTVTLAAVSALAASSFEALYGVQEQ